MSDPRYPIGPFQPHGALSPEQRDSLIQVIADTPKILREAVDGLDDSRLDTPYRDGGWSVRQVVHHVVDSHINGYVRLRWALTEDAPVVKPYEQSDWARLPDAASAPPEVSLDLLDALHDRLLLLLRAMTPGDFERTWSAPDFGTLPVDSLLELYAWHGRHHTAHITGLRDRMNW